jgi:4-hydroxybenzoate polyprenyltransferase/phosphoserine phosphatase
MQPLVVDLDGTLIYTDMLHESALTLLRDSPLNTLRIPLWLTQGKAKLKDHLARRADIEACSLPYNLKLIEWLKEQKIMGRQLILCTASHHSIAHAIAEHLGIFDEVMASDKTINLTGRYKADALVKRFGRSGFDYVGNSTADLPVWKQARQGIVVNASASLLEKAKQCCHIEATFPKNSLKLKVFVKILRVHQWLKNALLVVPIFAAHQLNEPGIWVSLLLAFISYSLCASAVYIANDLIDLESDRHHPRKRNRPFASGQVPAWFGVILAPLLLMLSVSLASLVPGNFLSWLMLYFGLTCAYSWKLKKLALIDCITLAMLYTLRIVAGASAAHISLSFWLLAFSVFLFLSLAFIKRYAELENMLLSGKNKVKGRGYLTTDALLVQTLGIASGYGSVLILALYINSETVSMLYHTPQFIWGTVPILLYWISWMWMQAHRGNMHDDPVIFAVKKRESLLAGAAFAIVLCLGTAGWPW